MIMRVRHLAVSLDTRMKKLNRNQWIGVTVGLALVTFFLYGGSILNLFRGNTTPNTEQALAMNIPQTGVVREDVVVGMGETASAGDRVTVHYVGTLVDGQVFDSSLDRNQPFTFNLGAGEVIRGWDEGVAGMQIGGKRRLIIAPDYAYGANAIGPIPANSPLIFEVELLNVEKGR